MKQTVKVEESVPKAFHDEYRSWVSSELVNGLIAAIVALVLGAAMVWHGLAAANAISFVGGILFVGVALGAAAFIIGTIWSLHRFEKAHEVQE